MSGAYLGGGNRLGAVKCRVGGAVFYGSDCRRAGGVCYVHDLDAVVAECGHQGVVSGAYLGGGDRRGAVKIAVPGSAVADGRYCRRIEGVRYVYYLDSVVGECGHQGVVSGVYLGGGYMVGAVKLGVSGLAFGDCGDLANVDIRPLLFGKHCTGSKE